MQLIIGFLMGATLFIGVIRAFFCVLGNAPGQLLATVIATVLVLALLGGWAHAA